MAQRYHDPNWLRAGEWIAQCPPMERTDLTVVGIPAHLTSVTPTDAHTTPAALRDAVYWYSTWSWNHDLDVSHLTVRDVGDVPDPDYPEGEERVFAAMREVRGTQDLLIALGGDNAITYSVARGLWGGDIGTCGLVTVDAHHDIRDGISNGSPVRRLIEEAGLPGERVVQIAISDFANSPVYARRAKEYGIRVITREEVRRRPLADIMQEALDIAGAGGGAVHYDLDMDVCDRSVAPACPAATPGGLSADEVRELTFLACADPRVTSMDITEIDATTDSADGRTVRLGALCILEAASGLAKRKSA